MVATRIHHGLALPELPAPPRQQVLELEPSACMPRGYHLERRENGLQLVRDADSQGMGIMPDADFAATHASLLARMEAMRIAQQETAA